MEEGSPYPALYRLEERGWTEAEWGTSENNRRAKFYHLTRTGRKQLEAETEQWRRPSGAVDLVLTVQLLRGAPLPDPPGPPGPGVHSGSRPLRRRAFRDATGGAGRRLLFRLNPQPAGYEGEVATVFYDEVSRSLVSIPGVRDVAISVMPLLTGWMSGGGFFSLPDHPGDGETRPTAHRHTASESYFATMGIPSILGRGWSGPTQRGRPRWWR